MPKRKAGKTIESTFNEALGLALASTTARWRSDSSIIQKDNRGKHPDILIADPLSPLVIIETSFIKADTDIDAAERLGARDNQLLNHYQKGYSNDRTADRTTKRIRCAAR